MWTARAGYDAEPICQNVANHPPSPGARIAANMTDGWGAGQANHRWATCSRDPVTTAQPNTFRSAKTARAAADGASLGKGGGEKGEECPCGGISFSEKQRGASLASRPRASPNPLPHRQGKKLKKCHDVVFLPGGKSSGGERRDPGPHPPAGQANRQKQRDTLYKQPLGAQWSGPRPHSHTSVSFVTCCSAARSTCIVMLAPTSSHTAHRRNYMESQMDNLREVGREQGRIYNNAHNDM